MSQLNTNPYTNDQKKEEIPKRSIHPSEPIQNTPILKPSQKSKLRKSNREEKKNNSSFDKRYNVDEL